VCIDLRNGKPADNRRAIADAVHQCMVSELKPPADDRFQVMAEHDSNSLMSDPTYLNIQRSDEVIFMQITLNEGRTLQAKQRFYRAVAKAVAARRGIRTQDVLINLIEVAKENWSFGNGIAQYAPEAKA